MLAAATWLITCNHPERPLQVRRVSEMLAHGVTHSKVAQPQVNLCFLRNLPLSSRHSEPGRHYGVASGADDAACVCETSAECEAREGEA